MKHIKKINTNNNSEEPKIRDWVICKEDDDNDEFVSFLNDNIGKIIDIEKNDHQNPIISKYYHVEFYNIPINIQPRFTSSFIKKGAFTRRMYRNEIIVFSKNKEDLEVILNANKYNL